MNIFSCCFFNLNPEPPISPSTPHNSPESGKKITFMQMIDELNEESRKKNISDTAKKALKNK